MIESRLMTTPFSVLMSFYSGSNPKYLNEAIDSIWTKQSVKPAQICLVQDGPVDEELQSIVKSWQSVLRSSLSVVILEKNQGLGSALNVGLRHCLYDLVARMDADDVSESNRFALQVDFMTKNQDVVVYGAQVAEFDDDLREEISRRLVPLTKKEIVKFAKYRSPFNHPSVMFRKSQIISLGGYPSVFPEDYALWVTLLLHDLKFANSSEILLKMRMGSALKNRRGWKFFLKEINLLLYFRKIGFYSNYELIKSVLYRFVYRLMPYKMKILVKKKLVLWNVTI